MKKIALIIIVLGLMLYLFKILALKLAPCPKCKRRGIEIIEETKYWKKFQCSRCRHTFVEETGH